MSKLNKFIFFVILFVSLTFILAPVCFAEMQKNNGSSVDVTIYSNGEVREFTLLEDRPKVDWNLLITIAAVIVAIFSAEIARRTLYESQKPVVVWKDRDTEVQEDKAIKRYKAHITVVNYGQGLAYLRKIDSNSKFVDIHISTPITLGKDMSSKLTFFFDKDSIDKIIGQCTLAMEESIGNTIKENATNKTEVDGFNIEFFEEKMLFTMTRDIAFDLYYLNTKRKCFKTYMDLTIRLDVYIAKIKEFHCFVNNECKC